MTFRPGDALRDQLLLQAEHQLAIFRVHRRQRAQFHAAAEARHQRLVIAHDGVLVGHEVLEAGHAVLLRERAHVAVDRLVPPGDRDMEAVVRRSLLRPAAPGLVGLHQRLLRIRDDEVDDAGGTARQARGGAGVEIIARHRAHEGQLHMRVRIDPARHHQPVAGIDHRRPGRRLQPLADRRDLPVRQQHIRAVAGFRIDHGATADQCAHLSSPSGRQVIGTCAAHNPEPTTHNRRPAVRSSCSTRIRQTTWLPYAPGSLCTLVGESRSSRRRILPTLVLGSSVRNSMILGCL